MGREIEERSRCRRRRGHQFQCSPTFLTRLPEIAAFVRTSDKGGVEISTAKKRRHDFCTIKGSWRRTSGFATEMRGSRVACCVPVWTWFLWRSKEVGGPKFDDVTGLYKREGTLKTRLTFSGHELLGCPMQAQLQKVYGSVKLATVINGTSDDCSLVLPHPPRRKPYSTPVGYPCWRRLRSPGERSKHPR